MSVRAGFGTLVILLAVATQAADAAPSGAFAAAIERAEQQLLSELGPEPAASDVDDVHHFLSGAIHHAWSLSGRARELHAPRFAQNTDPIGMPGLVNPDTRYASALLASGRPFTIFGVRGSHTQLTFQFIDSYPMIGLSKDLLVIDLNDLGIEAGQVFQLHFGGDEREENWWPLPEGAKAVIARQTFADWDSTPSALNIRPLGAPKIAPAPTPRVTTAAEYLEQIVALWSNTYLAGLRRLPVNQFPPFRPSAGQAGGLSGQFGVMAQFRLAADEALVVRVRASDAGYQSIQIGNRWFVTPDPLRTLASLNASQAHATADGYYHFVVSGTDPGIANWLDSGHIRDGFLMLRWQAIRTPLTALDQPEAMVVKLDAVRGHLPADVRLATPALRTRQHMLRRALPAQKAVIRLRPLAPPRHR